MTTHVDWEWAVETLRMIHASLHGDLHAIEQAIEKGYSGPPEHEDVHVRGDLRRARIAIAEAVDSFKRAFDRIDKIRARYAPAGAGDTGGGK